MIAELTDTQIARLLELCGKIAKIQQGLPVAPQGYDVSLEVAKHLRASLESENESLVELGALLR